MKKLIQEILTKKAMRNSAMIAAFIATLIGPRDPWG